ncbi:phosphatidylinositol N-acetylglucosaminyltransferase subunit C [Sitophilus oryzae]|uniref:Phosphatidylinositol N-acetylglucosaminyltransferase subunit C n=1 Tax=Sitophilus oryzae TaxID=7048 RepID=A0A6J2YS85_SITOR|nr:phosphatidylinositol N-acetylglucosaminyltransferase subunit C [Sitophilus oryzae]
MPNTSPKKPWRKILYDKQDYPDNYVDPAVFLKELKRNTQLKKITLWEAYLGANLFLQEFTVVVLFLIIYYYIVSKLVRPWFILHATNSVSLVGFLFYRLKNRCNTIKETVGRDVRTILTFVVFGQLFSPVLHTLTDTISTDTIYTTTFFMMLVHLIFFDYGVSAALVSNSLSLSAAMFASICLASRLSSANEAFVFLTISTQAFVLFPILRKQIGNSVILTVILVLAELYFLLEISLSISVLYFLALIFIETCPVLFVVCHKYRDNIHGPWDEAVVNVKFK